MSVAGRVPSAPLSSRSWTDAALGSSSHVNLRGRRPGRQPLHLFGLPWRADAASSCSHVFWRPAARAFRHPARCGSARPHNRLYQRQPELRERIAISWLATRRDGRIHLVGARRGFLVHAHPGLCDVVLGLPVGRGWPRRRTDTTVRATCSVTQRARQLRLRGFDIGCCYSANRVQLIGDYANSHRRQRSPARHRATGRLQRLRHTDSNIPPSAIIAAVAR